MKYVFQIIVLSVFLSACCKQDMSTLKSWNNPKNIAIGLANGKPWIGTVKLGVEDNGKLSIIFTKRDIDSVHIEGLLFYNIPAKTTANKLAVVQTYAIPLSVYTTGYADVFDDYDPDTTRTNILDIEQFDLDRGIIKGRLTAFYRFYRGTKAQPWLDTMEIRDMTFTYQR
jgi:hypothetical protein